MSATDKFEAFMSSARQNSLAAGTPAVRADESFGDWRNKSSFSDVQMAEYVSAYYFSKYIYAVTYTAGGSVFLTAGIVGLFGCLLDAVVLFHGKEFKAPSWVYHKFMSIIDLLAVPGLIHMGLTMLLPAPQRAYWMMYAFYNIALTIKKITQQGGDCIVFFMSLERCFAMWFPNAFHLVNKTWVVAAACVFGIFDGLTYVLDFYAYDVTPTKDGVIPLPSALSKSPENTNLGNIRMALFVMAGYGTIIATVILIVGILRRNRMRQRFINNDKKAKLEWKQNFQVCLLCLSCSVPNVVNVTIYATYQNLNSRPNGLPAAGLPFEVAMASIQAVTASYLIQPFMTFASCVGHCCHFYFYYAFNSTFRAKARDLLRVALPALNRIEDSSALPASSNAPSTRRESLAAGISKAEIAVTET